MDGKRSLNAEDLTEFDLSFLESIIGNVRARYPKFNTPSPFLN